MGCRAVRRVGVALCDPGRPPTAYAMSPDGVGDVPSRGVWVSLTEILFPLTEIWGSPVRGGVLPCGGGRPSLYGGSGSPVPGFGFPCTGKRVALIAEFKAMRRVNCSKCPFQIGI